jgi:predicted transcriptional regulator of viral defense system
MIYVYIHISSSRKHPLTLNRKHSTIRIYTYGTLMKNISTNIKKKLEKRLRRVFFDAELREELDELQENIGFSDSTKYKIKNETHVLKLKWQNNAEHRPLSFQEQNEFEDIIGAICHPGSRYYVSNYTALYWNELVNQKPSTYYISKEVANRTAVHSDEYNADSVRQVFMKSHRHTTRSFSYKKLQAFIVEKQDLDMIGLTTKTIDISGRKISFKMTDVERTLIDAVISPQYSGGIMTLIDCFSKARIDIEKLYNIYEKYNPYYPFWQIIGLLFEKTKTQDAADIWKSYFDMEMKEFYIDRKFRSDWEISDTWKIRYPKGIF